MTKEQIEKSVADAALVTARIIMESKTELLVNYFKEEAAKNDAAIGIQMWGQKQGWTQERIAIAIAFALMVQQRVVDKAHRREQNADSTSNESNN